jgi:ferredoxin
VEVEEMRVTVDPDKCQGTGYCEMISSTVFELGPDGIAKVLESSVDESQRELMIEAQSTCPTQAITVDAD